MNKKLSKNISDYSIHLIVGVLATLNDETVFDSKKYRAYGILTDYEKICFLKYFVPTFWDDMVMLLKDVKRIDEITMSYKFIYRIVFGFTNYEEIIDSNKQEINFAKPLLLGKDNENTEKYYDYLALLEEMVKIKEKLNIYLFKYDIHNIHLLISYIRHIPLSPFLPKESDLPHEKYSLNRSGLLDAPGLVDKFSINIYHYALEDDFRGILYEQFSQYKKYYGLKEKNIPKGNFIDHLEIANALINRFPYKVIKDPETKPFCAEEIDVEKAKTELKNTVHFVVGKRVKRSLYNFILDNIGGEKKLPSLTVKALVKVLNKVLVSNLYHGNLASLDLDAGIIKQIEILKKRLNPARYDVRIVNKAILMKIFPHISERYKRPIRKPLKSANTEDIINYLSLSDKYKEKLSNENLDDATIRKIILEFEDMIDGFKEREKLLNYIEGKLFPDQ